jgi:hypothetical protein
VIPAAVALLVVQLAFRSWAAWFGWYTTDDLGFLRQAHRADQWSYLLEPYNGHLMPGGKLVFWAIDSAGSAQWWPAVVYLVLGQAVASAACLWMLVTLFGRRWAILPPFSLYLFLSLTLPSYMWFVAATQQLPLQIVLSLAVGSWVRYLRGDGRAWLVATLVTLAVGLFVREKAMLVLPVLAFLSLFYFTAGRLGERARGLRRQGAALALVAILGLTYLVAYADRVSGQSSSVGWRTSVDLAGSMLGSTLSTGIVGGPWRWKASTSNSFADPPQWAVSAAWLVVGLVVVYILLRRRRSWQALLLFAGYAGGTYLLLLRARGAMFGGSLGTDARYLSDIPIVLCLCLALATAALPGAPGSSEPRQPELVARAPGWLVTALTAAVVLGGIISSIAYVRPWHDNEARDFFTRLDEELTAQGPVDLADRVLPRSVISPYMAPNNTLSFLTPLSTGDARFPESSSSLHVVDDDGRLMPAGVRASLASRPGKVPDCGWRVTDAGASVPLTGRADDDRWWMRIEYLATAPSTATVAAGESTFEVSLRSGLHDLFLRVGSGFDAVSITGVEPDVTVCVDTIQVGPVGPEDQA